jgi:hypothetical protein
MRHPRVTSPAAAPGPPFPVIVLAALLLAAAVLLLKANYWFSL